MLFIGQMRLVRSYIISKYVWVLAGRPQGTSLSNIPSVSVSRPPLPHLICYSNLHPDLGCILTWLFDAACGQPPSLCKFENIQYFGYIQTHGSISITPVLNETPLVFFLLLIPCFKIILWVNLSSSTLSMQASRYLRSSASNHSRLSNGMFTF